jgi:hypothetical protein
MRCIFKRTIAHRSGREFTDSLERMSRSETHGKKRPPHRYLARQINARP